MIDNSNQSAVLMRFKRIDTKCCIVIAAQLKMGDFHWYGYQGVSNTDKAVDYYGKAALQKDPQVRWVIFIGMVIRECQTPIKL